LEGGDARTGPTSRGLCRFASPAPSRGLWGSGRRRSSPDRALSAHRSWAFARPAAQPKGLLSSICKCLGSESWSQKDALPDVVCAVFTPADGDRDNLRAIVEHIGAHARHGVKMYAK